MYPQPGTDIPQHFLEIKIRNWWKFQCILAYIIGVCGGNRTKSFQVMYPGMRTKISVPNFRGACPLKFYSQKTAFNFAILGLYRKYFQQVTSYHQTENGIANCNVSLILRHHLMYFGPQTAKNTTVVSTHPWSIIVAIISPAFRG